MGRRKLEIKRIEDKSSRRVTFSKRRTGLMKKARQLSVLCDVDVAVVVFSSGGKVYESCSGNTTRVEHILARYEKSCLVAEGECSTSRDNGKDSPTKFQTCKELLQTVDRLVEDTNNSEEFSVTDMTQLAEELNAALMQTRSRKTELLMDHISTLQQKERELSNEKEEIQKQIASAMDIIGGEDDGGGGPNDIATNHINSPPLVTLSLFNG